MNMREPWRRSGCRDARLHLATRGSHDMSERRYRVAMMFAGDPSSRATLKLEETRLGAIAKALRNVGLDVEAAVYADEAADEVREQLVRVDGVLVWVDPVRKDGNRAKLDPLLCDVAGH